MSSGAAGRDGEIEAFVVDRYLESLLAREPGDATGVPPDIQTAARGLTALPRFHPSFRFEESLAARLGAVARRIEAGQLVDFPAPVDVPDGRLDLVDPDVAALADLVPDRAALTRPVVIGGVLTSAALSIAGAAWVAWRRGRSDGADVMARAVRAVARQRLV